jgi:hypothetical protein
VPQEWLERPDFEDRFRALAHEFSRSTRRIVSLYAFTTVIRESGHHIGETLFGREFLCDEHGFNRELDWRLFTGIAPLIFPQWWIRLVQLCDWSRPAWSVSINGQRT